MLLARAQRPEESTVGENTPPDAPTTEPREIHPITFFGKNDHWADLDLRPVPVPADQPEEDEADPKDSSVAELADSSVPPTGLEDALSSSPETTAPAEKDSGVNKDSSPGQPTSSSETPTSNGSDEQPVAPEAESTPKPSSPKSPTLPKLTKQSSPASDAK